MKYLFIAALFMCTAALAEASDQTRGVLCNGCSSAQTSARAASLVDNGTVYVFNYANSRVDKYRVFTEMVDTDPWTAWKQAVSVEVEPELAQAFAAWVAGLAAFDEVDAHIVLPGDFPIRSVAGALLDPGQATTAIESYLRELEMVEQVTLSLSAMLTHALRNAIPHVDFEKLVEVMRLTIEFPDGSTMDFEVSFSIDVMSENGQMELDSIGNARMEDGRAAPTTAYGFNGMTIRDRNGSLGEWILLARSLGLVVSGSSNGTHMRCEIADNVIHCTVIKKP